MRACSLGCPSQRVCLGSGPNAAPGLEKLEVLEEWQDEEKPQRNEGPSPRVSSAMEMENETRNHSSCRKKGVEGPNPAQTPVVKKITTIFLES